MLSTSYKCRYAKPIIYIPLRRQEVVVSDVDLLVNELFSTLPQSTVCLEGLELASRVRKKRRIHDDGSLHPCPNLSPRSQTHANARSRFKRTLLLLFSLSLSLPLTHWLFLFSSSLLLIVVVSCSIVVVVVRWRMWHLLMSTVLLFVLC